MSYLSKHLRKLGTGEVLPVEADCGICYELERMLPTYKGVRHVIKLMQSWPEYSGDEDYPVPHFMLPASDAYHYVDDLWGDDEYGNARRRLCTWLADQLEVDS